MHISKATSKKKKFDFFLNVPIKNHGPEHMTSISFRKIHRLPKNMHAFSVILIIVELRSLFNHESCTEGIIHKC